MKVNLKLQRGMSLVELLTAVAVASLMFMAMTNVLTYSIKSLRILQKRIDMAQQARLVLERMTRELASSFHPYGMYGETGARTPKPWLIVRAAATGGEEISFSPNLYQTYEFDEQSPKAPKSDITEIHYHVVTVSGQTHLYRRNHEGTLATIGVDPWTGGNDVMVAQNVRSLDFTVWDKDGASNGTYSYTGGELLFPSRVRVKITFYDPENYVDDMPFVADVSVMRNTVAGP